MKLSRWHDILDETVIEVETDFSTTVDRLMSMQGICRETAANECLLEFTCNKKGRLRVDKVPSRSSSAIADRLNFVVGEVVEQDGKTLVRIYAVHNRLTKVFRYITWMVFALVFGVFLAFLVSALKQGAILLYKDIRTAGMSLLLLFLIPFFTSRDTKNQPADLETMKTEALNRVRAVERWDE